MTAGGHRGLREFYQCCFPGLRLTPKDVHFVNVHQSVPDDCLLFCVSVLLQYHLSEEGP